MKLSEKQAIILLDIAKWSLNICGASHGYTHETVDRIVTEIINQQSNNLVDLDREDTDET